MTKYLLIPVLVLTMILGGCTWAEFDSIVAQLVPIAITILQVKALASDKVADPALIKKIQDDGANAKKLADDFHAASIAAQPGAKAQLDAAIVVLNDDLTTVFATIQVGNPNTQTKITALIGLGETLWADIESLVPNTKVTNLPRITEGQIVDSFNKILVAKTGDATLDAATPKLTLRKHSKVVHYATLGLLK